MLRLTLACERYDRTEALRDGRVRPDGVELTCLTLPVEQTFSRMLGGREFDLAEMSLSSYVLRMVSGRDDLVAVPVFLSRVFRHSSLYVRREAGIDSPAALAGRRVGLPHYQMTAAVWLRGILADDYGLTPERLAWVQGPLEHGLARIEPRAAPGVPVAAAPLGRSLVDMLDDGEIDALISARTPSSFHAEGLVVRLFGDPWSAEREWFERTRVFPIMHTLVVRRELADQHPWLRGALLAAFERAKELAVERLWETSELLLTLPFLTEHAERTVRLMGDDFWPYGLDANRATLELFLRYLREQRLIERPPPLEVLFPPL